MRAILILLACLVCRADDWRRSDTYWQCAILAINWIDYKQTCEIEPRGHYETNKLMGKHPTRATINRHFLGVMLASAYISYNLPVKYRRTWQVISFVLEARVVRSNVITARISIRF